MPILVWMSLAILAILTFNILFVAIRVWATRDTGSRSRRHPRLAPMYATISRRHRR